MRPTTIALCLSCCGLSVRASAQTATLPLGYETLEGKRARHVPLHYLPARIQTGFGAKATGWKATRRITELRARPDSVAFLRTAFTCSMQVKLSSIGCDPNVASNKWARNHGTDVATFLAKRTVRFAPFTRSPAPAPFGIVLKGDQPFLWRSAPLVVDWATYASSTQVNANFWLDATNVRFSGTRGEGNPYGRACNPTAFSIRATGVNIRERFTTAGRTQHAGDIVLSWIGASKIAVAVGPSCFLYTPLLLMHPQPARTMSATSEVTFDWGLVPSTAFGIKLYSQMAAFATRSIRWSAGLEITFGDYRPEPPFTIAHRYGVALGQQSFDPDTDDAQNGFAGTGLIFEVR